MNNNSEADNGTNPPMVNDISLIITAIKIVLLAIVLISFVKYTLISKEEYENNPSVSLQNKNESKQNVTFQLNVTNNEPNPIVVKKEIVPQPACPKVDVLHLEKICSDIVFKFYFCSPEDIHNPKKHKVPKFHLRIKYKNDPKGECIIL